VIGVWNADWAKPGDRRGGEIRRRLSVAGTEVVCFTEGFPGLLPGGGQALVNTEDYGYSNNPGGRKAMLWSARGWRDVELTGPEGMPPGRFVAGVTETSVGAIRVAGVCIPWPAAHVSTGRRDRRRWEDHRAYLKALGGWIAARCGEAPLVVCGDFNQRIPLARQPRDVYEAMREALGDLEVVTAGFWGEEKVQLIDHVACEWRLGGRVEGLISNWDDAGRKLTDHMGVRVSFGG
jgi:endonuclease/exonuclease/phosphatase family metal-dependent hydrolase